MNQTFDKGKLDTMKKIAYMLPVLILSSLSACAHNMQHHHNAGTEAGVAQAAAQVRKGQGAANKVDVAECGRAAPACSPAWSRSA